MVMLFLLALLPAQPASAGEIWIIADAKSSLTSVSEQTVKDAYLGKPTQTESGVKITAIDREDAVNGAKERFYTDVIQESNTHLKAYWSQMVFTGKGRPPASMETLKAVKQALSSNPTSITYIDPSEADPSMKVLLKVTTP